MLKAFSRFAVAASFPAFVAGQAFAQPQNLKLPSPTEVGQALALTNGCPGRDADPNVDVLCNPEQPVGATFRQILCVEYGSDADHDPIARCVYKGAQMKYSGRRKSVRSVGDGAIDVVRSSGTWLPTN